MYYDSPKSCEYISGRTHPLFDVLDTSMLTYMKDSINNKKIIDFACGQGHFTRTLSRLGAAKAVGVDISKEQIGVALREESRSKLGIEYIVSDASKLKKIDNFDIATAIWLFNYAKDEKVFLSMMKSIADNLKSGGKFFCICFIGFLDNLLTDYSKQNIGIKVYSLEKEWAKLKLYLYDPFLELDFTFYARNVFERNLRKAGFQNIIWHDLVLPEDFKQNKEKYKIWSEFIAKPYAIVLECSSDH